MSNQNILFYSKMCESSANLMRMMDNEGILKHFKLICIDGKEDKLPEEITHVPTLIVANVPRPLIAKEAFKWLQNVKYINEQKSVGTNKQIEEIKQRRM